MSAIAWWLVPLAAVFVAVFVVSLAGRPRRVGDRYQAIEQFRRFRTVMERETRELRK